MAFHDKEASYKAVVYFKDGNSWFCFVICHFIYCF
jgi:hypothetical protein